MEDVCCSAAYWVAAPATKIFADNETTRGLSIGTYVVINDLSEAFAKAGVQTHLIKAGEFKGAGVAGTKITDPQLREWQREVDSLNSAFVQDVARGRKVSLATARGWADGRTLLANELLKTGAIDGIQTLEATLDLAAKHAKRGP
jgi:ClpP class serine protease